MDNKKAKIILYDEATLDEKTISYYSLPAKQALINWIMSNVKMNNNTWDYPNEMDGIRESTTKQGVFYFTCSLGICQSMEY